MKLFGNQDTIIKPIFQWLSWASYMLCVCGGVSWIFVGPGDETKWFFGAAFLSFGTALGTLIFREGDL